MSKFLARISRGKQLWGISKRAFLFIFTPSNERVQLRLTSPHHPPSKEHPPGLGKTEAPHTPSFLEAMELTPWGLSVCSP